MASYVVMEPPGGDAGGRAMVLRDGFSLFAFLVPVVWLLVHRLWLEALAAVAATLGLAALGRWGGMGDAAALLSLLVSIYFGLEGTALRLAAWRRRGWRDWGTVEADSHRDAELRYIAEAFGEEPSPDGGPWRKDPAPVRRAGAGDAMPLGLFSYPGRS